MPIKPGTPEGNTPTTTDTTTTDTTDTTTEDKTPHSHSQGTYKDAVGEALDKVTGGKQEASAKDKLKELGLDGLSEEDLAGAAEGKVSYDDVLKNASPEVKAVLKLMRSDYSRKTQELAQTRKGLQAQREALLSSEFAKELETAANQEVKLDPFDDNSFEKRIEQEVAKRLQGMLSPIQEQVELQRRQASLDKFRAEHPDLETMKEEVKGLLLKNESLSLEDAYHIAKGQQLSKSNIELEEELNKHRQAAKEAGLKVGGSRRASAGGVPESVRKQGGWAIYTFLAAQKDKKQLPLTYLLDKGGPPIGPSILLYKRLEPICEAVYAILTGGPIPRHTLKLRIDSEALQRPYRALL